MMIDCGTCRGQDQGRCGDCVVTAMAAMPMPIRRPGYRISSADERTGRRVGVSLGSPEDRSVPLDHHEMSAVELFVRAGLIGPGQAAALRAWPDAWQRHRAVG